MAYVMGIDGGGSTVRAAVVADDLTIIGQATGSTVNPNVVGRDRAKASIQAVMRDALTAANCGAADVQAAGIGVAGAEAVYAEAWLREVVSAVLPDARIATPAGDHEIALVGAHGQRRGLLVLSGTGSLACGIGHAGEFKLVGALGYLLGDEGSGFWVGMEGMRAAMRGDDGRGRKTLLTQAILTEIGVQSVLDVVPWTYQGDHARTKDIAALARVVLAVAEQGDAVANEIAWRAANELLLAVRAVQHQLNMEKLPMAFFGGLLSAPNPLSRMLCGMLGLDSIPQPKYSALIGAAICALDVLSG